MTGSDICRLGIKTQDLNEAHHMVYTMGKLGYSTEQMEKVLLKTFETNPWETILYDNTTEKFNKTQIQGISSGEIERTVHVKEISEEIFER